jgi:hypothetical protein
MRNALNGGAYLYCAMHCSARRKTTSRPFSGRHAEFISYAAMQRETATWRAPTIVGLDGLIDFHATAPHLLTEESRNGCDPITC